MPDISNEPDKEILNSSLKADLRDCLSELPLDFKTIIILRDIQELSYDEISIIVELPLGTVKSRINRARLKLYECLKIKKAV